MKTCPDCKDELEDHSYACVAVNCSSEFLLMWCVRCDEWKNVND